MNETEELSLLVGDIYDASLDSALWPDAVNRIRTYVGAHTASLVSQDAVTKAVDVHFMLGPEQKFLDLYNEKYFKINPIFPTVMFLDIEQTNVVSDVLPTADLIQTRFAKEWIKPQALVDFLFSTLEKSSRGCTVFMTMRRRDEGFFDDAARQRFSLIVPHIRRALLIGKVIETHREKAAALADSLDTLMSGVRRRCRAHRCANAAALRHGREASPMRAERRLSATIRRQTRRCWISSRGPGWDTALGRRHRAVPIMARDDEHYVAHVLPYSGAAQGRCFAGAVAAVFVRKAALDLPSPPVVIARQFG